MVLALFTLYRYRKIVKAIRKWKEEAAKQESARSTEA
jgi:hypothetical protein